MRCQKRRLTLPGSVGAVQIQTDYGPQARGGKWLCPQREVWEIGPHQKMTPALQDRFSCTVTMTGSYENAAQGAGKPAREWVEPLLHQLRHGQEKKL